MTQRTSISTARVHPSAIVDPRAELADDVVIGPGSVIDGPVRIGNGTRLVAQVFLQGPLVIGEHNLFYPTAAIGFPAQHRAWDFDKTGAGVVIGSHNTFREGVTIHAAHRDVPTTLGDHNYMMANSHVGHDAILGDHCTLTNGSLVGGHCIMGDGVILGGNAATHQFCRIGRLAMVSGAAGISQDLPPFCVCYTLRSTSSLNLIGLRRAGLRKHITPLKRAFDLYFRKGHSTPVALEMIEAEVGEDALCREFADFIRASTRGITRYKAGGGVVED